MHEYTSLKRLNVSVKNPDEEATANDRWLPLGLMGADLDQAKQIVDNLTQSLPQDWDEIAYKDMLTPYTQESMVATRAYAIGQYICVGKKLYKTTAAITTGTTLSASTNIEETTLSGDVGDLKTQIEDISRTAFSDYPVNLNSLDHVRYIILGTNVWQAQGGDNYCNIYEVPDNAISISITGHDPNTYIAFLKTAIPVTQQTPDFADEYIGRKLIGIDETQTFQIYNDVKYIYILRHSSSGDITPTITISIPTVDSTLSKSGVAADAKSVGDALDKTVSWVDSAGVQAAISAGGILTIDPGKYFTAYSDEIASLFGEGNYPDEIIEHTSYIVETYHYGSSNRAYIIRRANGVQIFWGRYNTVSGFEWYDLSPGTNITVSSYVGGTELHTQTVNTVCRIQNVSDITDAPDGVDLNTYVGWLWTYGGTNKQQLLFYPHNNAIYQCIYRNPGSGWGWSKWFMISAAPRKTLKILAVGNSFTYSTLGYLPQIMSAMNPNIDFTLGICYDNGEPISGHIQKMTSPKTENPETYDQYSLWRSGASAWVNTSGKTLKWALLSDEWDYIILQEAPTHVTGNASDVNDLKTLAGLITSYMAESGVTHPFNFLYNLPQCYGPNYSGLAGYCNTHGIVGQTDEEKSNGVMEYIAAYAERALNTPYVIGVLPGGMAVQNARQIAVFKAIGAANYLYLTNDNIGHLQNGFGPLIAGYANAMKLLDLIGDKIPAFSIPFTPTNEWLSTSGLYTKTTHGAIDETANTDANFIAAQQCAMMAYKNPFEISEI